MATKAILTEAELMERWHLESPKAIATHRAKGLKAFRVANKVRGDAPGQSLWRYRIGDVEAYEASLVAASAPAPKAAPPAPAVAPMAGWDGKSRLGTPRRRVRGGAK